MHVVHARIRVDADGTISGEAPQGVPPGEYDLRVYLERRDDQAVPAGVAIGEPGPLLEAEHVITVPEGPADQPVDLGVLEPGNAQRPGL